MPRKLSPRRVHRNRLYTTTEAAEAVGGKPQTIQSWIWREGLKTADGSRPHLIRGSDLIAFMKARYDAKRQTCAPDELYCLGCKAPRQPAFEEADLIYRYPSGAARIRSLCPICTAVMCQVFSAEQLAEFARNVTVIKNVGLHPQNN
jgi:hypothetical protein